MTRLSFALLVVACATALNSCAAALSPAAAHVAVYQAPLAGPPEKREMPTGCTLVSSKPPVAMTELEMQGQDDPYRIQRSQAVASGGNTLLVLSEQTQARRDVNCPGGLKITDCPGTSGAWYKVAFETYECSQEALNVLSPPPAVPPTGSQRK